MRELDKKLRQAFKRLAIKPGDIYESCSYHPVLCLGVDYKNDEIWGVSLVDGSHPRACSLLHCGVKKLSPKQAWHVKMTGPVNEEVRNSIKPEARWWNGTSLPSFRVGLVGPKPVKRRANENAG